MKLKAKVDDINYVFEEKPMFVYHVNATIRYGNKLDAGLFNLTINPNYVTENLVPDLQIKKEITNVMDPSG